MTTKLVYFTDLHLRVTPAPDSQFHVQPMWRGEMRELFSRLGRLAKDADAIAFTGDAAHGGGKQEVAVFFDLLAEMSAGKSVFLVMGNHDVVHPDWENHFRLGCEKYPNMRFQDGVYPIGEMDIALINNEYLTADGAISTSWRDDCFPIPAMSEAHAAKLDANLSANSNRSAIAMVHCPTHVLPPAMIDFAGKGVLAGMDRYRNTLHGVLDRHPRVRAVLSGHVHFSSTMIAKGGRVQHSLSSVAEYPQQVRIVECDAGKFCSRLVSLALESETEA